MNIKTLKIDINKLLESHKIRAEVQILASEITIQLNIPPDCHLNLREVRQLIMEYLSAHPLQRRKIVKIVKNDGAHPVAKPQITHQDILQEIFQIPNQSFLTPREIQQFILED